MSYTQEKLSQDIDWLKGYGIDSTDAKKFIQYLLKQTMR